jgi:hypothetical protein
VSAIAPPELTDAAARVRRLRAPLLAELQRPRRAARLRPARALALATLALAIALAAGVLSRDPAPALAVERQDGWLVLRIADVSAGEAALTRELSDAGIPGEVRLLPVPADRVGTWAVIAEHADAPGTPRSLKPGPEEVVRLGRVRYERETLRIPIADVRESTGYFVFYAGRAARPGEEPLRDRDLRYSPLRYSP